MSCPELESEARSAIEARQLSELLSQGGAPGTLLLVCSGDRVSGTWQEGGVVLDSRFLSRNQGEGAVELLHWVASVLLEMRREREAERQSGRASATGPVVAVSAASAAAVQPEEIQPPAPTSAAPASPQPAPAEAAVAAPTVQGDAATSPTWAFAKERFTFDVSAVYAHFGTELAGAAGPRLGLRIRFAERLRAVAVVDAKLGLGSTSGFGLLDFSAALGVAFDVHPFVSVCVAPLLDVSIFQVPTETSGSTAPVLAGGVVAAVRARLPFAEVRPFLDLGVQAVTPARQVTLSGAPVLTVPTWQALFAVGAELAL